MFKPIRRMELIKGGTAVKQGEIFTLGFQLFDADGIVIVPTGGQTLTVKVANSTGVVYETVATVVSDRVEFTVDENIGAGKMRVELTVADGVNVLQKYPANGYIELYITASLDDIGTGTIYTVTAAQMFARIEGSEVASAEALVTANEAKETADVVRAEFDLVVAEAGSSNPEVVLARGGEANLSTRLNGVDSQLADKADKAVVEATNLRVDSLVINSGSANAEVTDSHVSTIKNRTFTTLRNRLESVEKESYIPARNILVNGDFTNNLVSWTNTSAGSTTATTGNNEVTITTTSNNGLQQNINLISGHKYYISAKYKTLSGTNGLIRLQTTGFVTLLDLPVSTTELKKNSVIYTATSTAPIVFYLRVATSSVLYRELTVLDLTEIFGVGNEPTVSAMDSIFSRIAPNSFDGNLRTNDLALNAYTLASTTAKQTLTLKWELFGDSITDESWGDFITWATYIPDYLGTSIDKSNKAIGGSKLSKDGVATNSVVERMTEQGGIRLSNDVITVFAGTNDWSQNQQIGTFLSNDVTTIYGAVKKIIEYTIFNHNSLLMFVTPLKRNHTSDDARAINAQGLKINANGNTLNDVVDAIAKTCEWYGIPYVDLNKITGINEINARTFMSDGLHPISTKLEKRMASLICNDIKKYYLA